MVKNLTSLLAVGALFAVPQMSSAQVDSFSKLPAEIQQAIRANKVRAGETPVVAKDAVKIPKLKTLKSQSPLVSARKSFTAAVRQYQGGTIAQTASLSPVTGYVAYSPSEELADKFHAFDATTGAIASTFEADVQGVVPMGGGSIIGETYYSFYIDDTYASWFGIYFFYLCKYNAETMEPFATASLDYNTFENYVFTSCSYNDQIFAQTLNEDASALEWAIFDPETGARTKVADADLQVVAITSAANGTIYGIGSDNALYTINGATGAGTKVADLDFEASDADGAYKQSIAYDDKSGNLYWFAVASDASQTPFFKVNVATGELTSLCDDFRQVYGAVVPQPAAEDAAPAAAENLAAVYANGSLDGTISFTMPSTTFAGETLVEGATYTVTANNAVVASAAATPGEAVTVNATLEEGVNNIVVTSANAAGTSPKAKTSLYVGYDTPKAPANVVLAIDDEGKVDLSWDAATEGVHAGYLGAITYNVYRGADQVASALTTTTFSETLPAAALAQYVYTVEAVNGSKVSAAAASNGVVYGAALDCPVSLNYADESSFAMSTVIDANEDGKTWVFSSTTTRYTYSSANQADDWLLTPQINLVAGRNYILRYTATSQSDYFPETLEVLVGKGATVEAMTTTLVEAYNPTATKANEEKEIEFKVAESGKYCVGFHAISDADQYYLNLWSVEIEAGALPEAPGQATDYSIVVGEEGQQTVSIAFRLPTINVEGNELTSPVSKVTVARDGQIVDTFEGAKAQQPLLIAHDRTAPNGIHTYTVVCYNAYGAGAKSVTEQVYVGNDEKPEAPHGVLTDQKTSVLVEWAPISNVGTNGGYVDLSDVTYELYTVESGYIGSLLYSGTANQYTVETNTDEGEMQLLQYAMRAVTSAGNSSYVGTEAIVVGAPVELPFIESVAGGAGISTYWWIRSGEDTQWSLSTDAADEDGGSFSLSSETPLDTALIASGKINIKGTANPQLFFYGKTNKSCQIEVVAMLRDGSEKPLKTVAAKTTKWTQYQVDLNELKNEDFVMIGFYGETLAKSGNNQFSAYSATAGIDGIMVRDVLEHNLVVTLNVPDKVAKGQTATVAAVVSNEGANDANGFTVKFTCNDAVVAEIVPNTALASFGSAVYSAEIPTTIFDEEDELVVAVEVAYELELKEDDNTDVEVIALTESKATPIYDLAGTKQDGAVVLTWKAPEASAQSVSEGFESYENCTAFPYTENTDQSTYFTDWNQEGSLGEWTAYDLDGGSIYGWNSTSINWPYTGDGMAFAVIDVNEVFGAAYENPASMAHTGDKILICMDIAPANGGPSHNDDWLISPELAGCAQTISFWANEITDQYGHETFEVWYSTTNKKVESFVKVGEGSTDAAVGYQQFSYDLPEGTKYFAIRVTSADIFGMFIDDIEFMAGASAPTSFNVYLDKQAAANVEKCTYTDNAATAQLYSVTAVYAGGIESKPVSISAAEVEGIVNGIESLTGDKKSVEIYSVDGVRVNNVEKKGLYITKGQKFAQ